jgi:hypothetical protein
VQQTATAGARKAYATQAVQSARETLQAFNAGRTATAQAGPTRTVQAFLTATAARATYVSQLTAQAQATKDRGTQRAAQATGTYSAQQAAYAETASARATLEAGYVYTAYYNNLMNGGKVRFRAYVASISGQEVQVYTSTPDRIVVVELTKGLDPGGLTVSTTVAYTFYGQSTGNAGKSICDGHGCRIVPHIIEAGWLP